ncbi:M48 family metallopeptidase [Streptomyces sp. NPDC053069]|uniref:M48 family metallopeptidase n=1 Tax=Streptomyces sp. NPDC053069 TaxID=3365695 RepID=UPI0037D64EA1
MTQKMLERPPRNVALDDLVVKVRVRESKRASKMRLIMGPQRPAEVIVPSRASDREVDEFINSKRAWLKEKGTLVEHIRANSSELKLNQQGVVWLLGSAQRLQHQPLGRAIVRRQGESFVVGGSLEEATAAVDRWYRRQARIHLASLIDTEASRLGVEYRSVGIRDQRTRWGSCSGLGNLSFSWRLVMAPLEVSQYVVTHELCHLRQPNHSKAFWRLVDAAAPGWTQPARWLRAHGEELRGYRPSHAL